MEFLLAKTQELRRQREAFEAQEKTQGKVLVKKVQVQLPGSHDPLGVGARGPRAVYGIGLVVEKV